MELDSASVESRIDEISRRLGEIERRLGALEEALGMGAEAPAGPGLEALPGGALRGSAAGEPLEPAPAAAEKENRLVLTGRTLVALGGAYLLRAITEAGIVEQALGIALGLAYAVLWILFADRAAARRRPRSAVFHGAATAVIAFPLLWETTVKLRFFPAAASAAAVSAVALLGLVVAWRRSLLGLAWAVLGGAVPAAIALAFATGLSAHFAFCLVSLGLAALWLVYLRGWEVLGWVVALAVDFMVLLETALVLDNPGHEIVRSFGPAPLVAVQLAFMLVYLGSFLTRTLARGADVSPPEMVQAAAVAFVGLGGASVVARVAGALVVPLVAVSLLIAAGSYGVSFTFIDRRLGRRRNFIFYTTLALLFTLAGLGVSFEGPALAGALAAAALLSSAIGSWKSRATLSLHGAVYIVVAALASGLLKASLAAFLGRAPAAANAAGWERWPLLVVLAVDAVACALPVAAHGRTWGRGSRVPKLLMLAVLALGAGGIAVTAGAWLLERAGSKGIDPAYLAALRTGVLAAAALLLAVASRWQRFLGASWLVFPVLIAGAAKLLIEDLPAGRPATLFLSLGFYGGALILIPRLLRRAA